MNYSLISAFYTKSLEDLCRSETSEVLINLPLKRNIYLINISSKSPNNVNVIYAIYKWIEERQIIRNWMINNRISFSDPRILRPFLFAHSNFCNLVCRTGEYTFLQINRFSRRFSSWVHSNYYTAAQSNRNSWEKVEMTLV